MGNFFAYPTFKQKFGSYFGQEKGWQVPGAWQTGLSMGSTVGTIFGEFSPARFIPFGLDFCL